MLIKDRESNRRVVKLLQFFAAIFAALLISAILTCGLILYNPAIFKRTITLGFELLPPYRFSHSQVITKAELAKQFGLPNPSGDDARIMEELRQQWPNTKDRSTFFARMFGIRDYPVPCGFTIIGMHRTMDVAWTLEGLRCDDKKSCTAARDRQCCPSDNHHGYSDRHDDDDEKKDSQ